MGLDDVVQGYASLATSMVKRWNSLVSDAAKKVDAGEYDSADWAADVTSGAALATEGGLLWAAETVDAVTGMCIGPNLVKSRPFTAPAGAKLELEGALVKGPKLAELPEDVVTIEPAQLGATDTEFRLSADATNCRGATYVGTVKATTDDGPPTDVIVWIVVP